MPFFIPVVVAVGGFVVRRWVWVAGVGLVAMYYDEAGELIGDAIGEEANEIMEDQLANLQITLKNVAGDVANSTLDVVRGLGSAIVDGLDSAYDATRAKLDGREPDVIAGIVVVALTVLTVTYIYHSAKAAGDAF